MGNGLFAVAHAVRSRIDSVGKIADVPRKYSRAAAGDFAHPTVIPFDRNPLQPDPAPPGLVPEGAGCFSYLRASTPAMQVCESWAPAPPLQPIAPTILPPTTSGKPPCDPIMPSSVIW